MFYGVVVYMYFYDVQRHHTPHFHVEYAEFTAVICRCRKLNHLNDD